jgi:RNA polymerase sigma-70 factor (ECF subfamily)
MNQLITENTEEYRLTDEEVFLASLKDPEQFSEIVDRYQAAFIRKAKGILVDEEEAYDAVQEAFVRIYSAAKQYRKQEGAVFKSWAYKILMNQCFTMYQKKKKERLHSVRIEEEFMEVIPDRYQTEAHETKLTKEYLLSLVSRLPRLLARVVTLHFIEEKPQKEIAESEGVSNEVVRARIHRAKKELRNISLKII